MKLVFCGTPEFAVPSLEAVLAAGHEVALVVTQPDKPAGRGMDLRASAVKKAALAAGLPVDQPATIRRNEEFRAKLEEFKPDAICVVAFGKLIPDWMLALPRFGNINVHGSLLPKYRGAAPVQWAVANGETETGVTTMRLDAGLDTGDTLVERRLPIAPDATSVDIFPQLATIGAQALVETLAGLQEGSISPSPQDHSQATLAPILTRDDARVSPESQTAQQIYNRWRGFSPWPGSFASLRGKRFIFHRLSVKPHVEQEVLPGALTLTDEGLLLGASQGSALLLEEVQLEGKPRMAGAQFARDFQLKPGERVE